jgi:hypothetical protein
VLGLQRLQCGGRHLWMLLVAVHWRLGHAALGMQVALSQDHLGTDSLEGLGPAASRLPGPAQAIVRTHRVDPLGDSCHAPGLSHGASGPALLRQGSGVTGGHHRATVCFCSAPGGVDPGRGRVARRATPPRGGRAALPARCDPAGHLPIQACPYPTGRASVAAQEHTAALPPAHCTILTTWFPDTVETQPELLAHHYTAADLKPEGGSPYWPRHWRLCTGVGSAFGK